MPAKALPLTNILVNYPAQDRIEAVTAAGELLVQAGAAKSDYVKAMLENLAVNGNYLVIAPGIAMPHARPETGALASGFSLVTLQKPVNFGHPINDPVRLVLGFCAVDAGSHLATLASLVELLADQTVVEQILAATDPATIQSLIGGI